LNEGELKKRLRILTSFATPYTLTDEEQIKINEIIEQLRRINERNIGKIIDEAKQDLFDYFRRGLIHEGLVKWLGAEKPKPTHVYSELELKKMAYGLPVNIAETSKNE